MFASLFTSVTTLVLKKNVPENLFPFMLLLESYFKLKQLCLSKVTKLLSHVISRSGCTQDIGSSSNAPYHAHPQGMLLAKHTSPPSYFLGPVMKTGDLRIASFFMFPLT